MAQISRTGHEKAAIAPRNDDGVIANHEGRRDGSISGECAGTRHHQPRELDTFARTNPHGDPGQRSTTRQLTRLEADDSTPEPT